jgi:hypothetical protein
VEEFKNVIDLMLSDNRVKKGILDFKKNRDELNRDPDSPRALKLLIRIITTQA